MSLEETQPSLPCTKSVLATQMYCIVNDFMLEIGVIRYSTVLPILLDNYRSSLTLREAARPGPAGLSSIGVS